MVMSFEERERLSAAMDGELEQDLGRLLGEHRQEEDFKTSWFAFHLIGDVLRDGTTPYTQVHEKVADTLKKEPAYLLPAGVSTTFDRVQNTDRFRWVAVAAALFVVLLSTVILRPVVKAPMTEIAQRSITGYVAPEAAIPADQDLQTLVALHRQASPLAEFQTVDYTPDSSRE